MEQNLKSVAAPVLAILHNEKFRGRLSYLDAATKQWVEVLLLILHSTWFLSLTLSSRPLVG